MTEKLRTKVTTINGRHHVRLLEDDLLINEMACELKIDIGWCCREMLRWYDKLGGNSAMADRSRHRQKRGCEPEGRIWREKDLRPNRAKKG